MPTFNCPDCGNIVSDSASNCGRCNRPVTEADRHVCQVQTGSIHQGYHPPGTSHPVLPQDKGEPKKLIGCLKWAAIAFFGIIALGVVVEALKSPEQREAEAQARIEEGKRKQEKEVERLRMVKEMEKSVTDLISRTGKYGNYSFKIESDNEDDFSGVLIFDKGPMLNKEAEIYGRAVVQTILNELVSRGRSPSDEYMHVTAFVYTKVKGATGSDLVRTYGFASYDDYKDIIEWNRN